MSLSTIIYTLLIFGVLISTHEFGHFIVAKKCGVIVEEFSIGMGPLIFKKKGKDETLYSLRLLPIGGYCKMYGEDEDEEETGEGSLNSISPFKRILVFAAGAGMNLLSAIIILMVVYGVMGTEPTTTIGKVLENNPAYTAGLREGDTFVKINDTKITKWEDISNTINSSKGRELKVTYKTESGELKDTTVTPKLDSATNSYKVGINPTYSKSFIGTVKSSVKAFGTYIYVTFKALIDLIRGAIGINQLSGPIGVAGVINEAVGAGFSILLNITALLTINIGIFNLLPIPALDGSRILFCFIEMIKGSPINREKEGMIHFVGFVLLMAFAVFVAVQDVIKLF
ncbi:RIP metalloprotease RseP [uncultured Anaerofustis sp.]|uniref:RIP metalloprotease RseP n=1 Tax=uncultured Anaerofustis sp. TaxID=904996 RepID=UPI0025E11D8A|nr:RIP metalloprotease RseP [uncultured Anaerofustis sp.]